MRMKSTRTVRSGAVVLAVSLSCFPICFSGRALRAQTQTAPQPVNPHATPEARALLSYIDSISGKATIAGQHNYPNVGARWTDMAYDLSGKYPGLFGADFGFAGGDDKDSVLARPAIVAEVERQYRNGAVIALTWHMVRPTDDEPVTFHDSVQGHLTDYEWKQLLTPGTPLYERWCAQVDVVAGYLRQLQEAHVPVLFRPFHEMNGGWFWWGGRPGPNGSAALYRQLYDRYVNVDHLDNLVWVWNVNAPSPGWPPIAGYYPGSQYVDVATMDIYRGFHRADYESMIDVAAGKPIALAEVGRLPTPEILEKQPRWAYFMDWSEFIQQANPLSLVKSVYDDPRVLTRDDARLAGPMAAIRAATEERTGGAPEADPVSAEATPEARALLARLLTATDQGLLSGKDILSGQENDPAAPDAATAAVARATGREPAIYAADLGTSAGNRAAIVEAALRAHARHEVVSLSWRAARPTDDAPAKAHGQLTDFEWNDLLTAGSDLNRRWEAQVDTLAETLRPLAKADVAVLWHPYPESNGNEYWWAGRKGIHGSAELYRRLFDRMVHHDGLHNLVWVWEALPPGAAPDRAVPGAEPVPELLNGFFPGLLYVDALELRLDRIDPYSDADQMLKLFATGKPIGVEFSGTLPPPDALFEHPAWAWFVASPESAGPAGLRALYVDPRILSLPAAK